MAAMATAVAATGLQLDREARKNPAVAPWVPSAFQAYAAAPLAREAYARGEFEDGAAYARTYVRRRPIPAEGLSLLTMNLLGEDKEREALPALLLASQRGWRDTYTQLLITSSAEQVGESEVASQRLLALWRLQHREGPTQDLTANLLSMPGGPQAFANGLDKADLWITPFLTWAITQNVPSTSLETIADAIAEKSVPVDCSLISGPLRTMARRGAGEAAQTVWSRSCPDDNARAEVGEFAFRKSSAPPGPSDWAFPRHAGLTTSLVSGPAGIGLDYRNTEHMRVSVAQRITALKPGEYVLSLDYLSGDAMNKQPIVLKLTCYTQDGQNGPAARLWMKDEAQVIRIPDEGCNGQEFALLVAHGSGTIGQFNLEPASAN
ncbi:hypothetical protein [Novosphingobium profundi]|uniref:hypothetical protein n=1 Tax=Novosphingobium profundi TaxID=1774954 RepID=UPI001CFD1F33|nr:hypothetical protein [Novosphingobium profundi]